MTNEKAFRNRLDNQFAFFQEFLKHPRQVASIIPSSHFLEQRVIKAASVKSAKSIVELGSGTGGITRAILRHMAQHASLLSIEINTQLHTLMNQIEDDRLIAHLGDALDLKDIISMYKLDEPDVIISGIPISTMCNSSGNKIIEAISFVLAPGGRFVAYQLSDCIAALCKPYLGVGQVDVEFFNIPPLRVYRWDKHCA